MWSNPSSSNTVFGNQWTNPTLYKNMSNEQGNIIENPRAWNIWTWQQEQQSNWNWVSTSTAPSTKASIESVNSIGPSFVPPILSKSPPSFPMSPFSHNNYWAGPNTTVLPPSKSDQWNNKLNMMSKVDNRTQVPSFIDAVKRKQLPAWIREGLEKMKKKKQRKIEQKQSFGKPGYSNSMNGNIIQELPNSPINFYHETQMSYDDIEYVSSDYINKLMKSEFVKNDPSPLIPYKTKAQIWEDTMLSLRNILTKLLMDVTNDMMLSVVKKVLKTTLKTGLEVYGSECDSSDESDEKQHSSGHKQLKQDSDKAIQERILKRQREFINIEAKILIELEQLEDMEKLVRSKFDNSIKLNEEMNDIGSQVVKNIQIKGCNEDVGFNQNIVKSYDIVKKELSNDLNFKNGAKNKSKSKRFSSSSSSSCNSDGMKDNYTDNKCNYKIKSESLNQKSLIDSVEIIRRSQSRNKSISYSRLMRSRSRSRHDKRTPYSFGSRQSQSPLLHHSYFRKYKSQRNSSSSSSESSSN